MNEHRIIPILLLSGNGFVKTKKFKNPVYLGDAINTVKIFNNKGVDELVVFDINVSKENKKPNYIKLKEISSESFVPLSYGGGIKSVDHAYKVLRLGYEKVVINTNALKKNLIYDISSRFGSSSTSVCIDYKKNLFGSFKIISKNREVNSRYNILEFSKFLEDEGAGELILQSVEKDGTFNGYDIELVNKVSSMLSIPVIVAGGASNFQDFINAINNGASAVSAGSMFVFKGIHNAVLINYPSREKIINEFYKKIN